MAIPRILSTGIGIQVLYAVSLRDKKTDIAKAVELINARREHVTMCFVVDKLTYLHKGGRCSGLALLGANMLALRPSIILDNGKMIVGKKYMGKMHKILDKFVEDIGLVALNKIGIISDETYEAIKQFNNIDKSLCFVTYSSATEEMLNVTHDALAKVGFEQIIDTTAGCTVSTHCGPNTLGVGYYNDNK